MGNESHIRMLKERRRSLKNKSVPFSLIRKTYGRHRQGCSHEIRHTSTWDQGSFGKRHCRAREKAHSLKSAMIGKRSDFKHVKCETKDRSIRSGCEKCQISGADPSFTDVLIFKKKYIFRLLLRIIALSIYHQLSPAVNWREGFILWELYVC